jgi:Dolichyl-phosphate-mannose-protein mannosyltransferase
MLSWQAVQTKCATIDEPLHAVSAYLSTFDGDYRFNPEDPPLWKYWAMIPHVNDGWKIDREGATWWEDSIKEPRNQSGLAAAMLYETPGLDGIAFIEKTRAMFLIVGVTLGICIAYWSWQLGGGAAAIAATAFFAFDPSFLAHSPLIKNDVAMSLAMLIFMFFAWRIGKRATPATSIMLGLSMGMGLAIKFTGVLLPVMLFVVLAIRIVLPDPWPVLRSSLAARGQKIIAAACVMAMTIAIAWIVIWASYRFRYASVAQGHPIDTPSILRIIAEHQFELKMGRLPVGDEAQGLEQTAFVRAALFVDRHHLLPQAWTNGLLLTYGLSIVRDAYLLGTIYDNGRWYYFPLVMLFKMPLATLAAMLLGFVAAITLAANGKLFDRGHLWISICLLTPILIYGLSAIQSKLNIGIRHLLPIFPFIFILLGVGASALKRARPRLFNAVAIILGLGLAIETLSACPDFIPFFNVAAGGARGGIRLLGDSNLDWGQDLPELYVWQQNHPDVPLYLLYFGRLTPKFYGIKGLEALDRPCVVGISATVIQGLYVPKPLRLALRPLLNMPPREVLGGTVYLYQYPDDFSDPEMVRNLQLLKHPGREVPMK